MHLTSSSLSCILICLLFNDQVLAQEESVRPLHFYSPCTFPVSFSNNPIQNREHYRVCGKKRHLSFVCDLHFQLHQQNVFAITKAFEKHRVVLEQDQRPRFEILVVKWLAVPDSISALTEDNADSKTFTKIYTTALFERWFPTDQLCKNPRVLALVVLDGMLADTRKLISVNLHTDDRRFLPFISNIQLESANALLQGMPLVDALADLVDQVGFAFREFYATQAQIRRHIVPLWAWELAVVSVILVVVALGIEWYIVRRSLAVKRSIAGPQTEAVRRTHLIF
ncbi:hypothetical protein M3Y97_00251200 [Aphelenchoides bicaudatus]|nr:hypothetical protein M3Y97_00251200 [Aphelenchoides bicaudatus]